MAAIAAADDDARSLIDTRRRRRRRRALGATGDTAATAAPSRPDIALIMPDQWRGDFDGRRSDLEVDWRLVEFSVVVVSRPLD